MKYSGVRPKHGSKVDQSAVHAWLLDNKSASYSEAFFSRSDILKVCPQKFCTDIDELLSASKAFGMTGSLKRNVALNSKAVFDQVRGAIEQRRPMIVPTGYDVSTGNGDGHFWIIAGYVDKGNPENTVLLLEDVASRTGGTRWDKKVLIKDFVNGLIAYRSRNGYSTSSFNMLILK